MTPEYLSKKANEPGKLNVLSMFLTVDGEANYFHSGTWSLFIRLNGCRVGCRWCDTKYSWKLKQGEQLTPQEVFAKIETVVSPHYIRKVTITGGEPLEQDGPEFQTLLGMLVQAGWRVTLETAGTHFVQHLVHQFDEFDQFKLVLDIKPPSAHALQEPAWENFLHLDESHTVKIVIADRDDFDWAVEKIQILRDPKAYICNARIVLSPSHQKVTPRQLFDWMKSSPLPSLGVGLNMQMHKYIFSADWRDEEKDLIATNTEA